MEKACNEYCAKNWEDIFMDIFLESSVLRYLQHCTTSYILHVKFWKQW
jgi:hypothetical protein